MHLAIQANAVDDLASIGFESAAIVMQLHIGEVRDQLIGQHGWQTARQGLVLAVLAPARDHVHIGIGFEALQQQRDIAGFVLQIGVQRHHIAATHAVKASLQGTGLAIVANQTDGAYPGVLFGQFTQALGAAIRGAIVDCNEFVAQWLRAHGCVDACHQVGQVVELVIDRNNDGNFRDGIVHGRHAQHLDNSHLY